MTLIELSVDEIVGAFSEMLANGIQKDVLPSQDTNKYGIDVLRHKRNPYLLMFHFITVDGLEVNLEFDVNAFQAEGKHYLDHLYGLLCDQTEEARRVRDESASTSVYFSDKNKRILTKRDPVAEAIEAEAAARAQKALDSSAPEANEAIH